MSSDQNQCVICGSTENVHFEVSRNRLIFGGFRGIDHEYRCEKCEAKLSKRIEAMLESLFQAGNDS